MGAPPGQALVHGPGEEPAPVGLDHPGWLHDPVEPDLRGLVEPEEPGKGSRVLGTVHESGRWRGRSARQLRRRTHPGRRPLRDPAYAWGMVAIVPLLVGLSLPVSPLQSDLPAPSGPAHLVRVEGGLRALARLQRLGADIVERDLAPGGLKVLADDAQLAFLESQGLTTSVEIEDLAAHYAARLANTPPSLPLTAGQDLGAWLQPPFSQGGMGGYYTWDEVTSVLDQIHAAYPSIVGPRTSLGTSLQGRGIWSVKVSDTPGADEPEPEVRIDSMHHAREPQSMQTSIWYLLWLCENYGTDPLATYLVDERETWFVPVVNPDGYVYNQQQQPGGGGLWRKNRRDNGNGSTGVDLNRNYPFEWGYDDQGSSSNTGSETYRGTGPVSEPETAAMVAFIEGREFATALSMHTYSDLWLAPWGYIPAYPPNWTEFDEVGTLATEVNGYPHDPASLLLYAANGVTFDYDYGVNGTLAWTPEIGSSSDGFWALSTHFQMTDLWRRTHKATSTCRSR